MFYLLTYSLWNLLLSKLRQCDSLEEFKQLLKTHLQGRHGSGSQQCW